MGAKSMLFRRTGAVGVALTAYDIWRRIPRKHRRAILANARKHGPRVAKVVVAKAVVANRKRR